jgi:hypothetical protein
MEHRGTSEILSRACSNASELACHTVAVAPLRARFSLSKLCDCGNWLISTGQMFVTCPASVHLIRQLCVRSISGLSRNGSARTPGDGM